MIEIFYAYVASVFLSSIVIGMNINPKGASDKAVGGVVIILLIPVLNILVAGLELGSIYRKSKEKEN